MHCISGPLLLILRFIVRENFQRKLLIGFINPKLSCFGTAYMARHGLPYRIYVVEQLGGQPFNRGWLLNHGFLAAENETDYVVTHDVDMLPLGARGDHKATREVISG